MENHNNFDLMNDPAAVARKQRSPILMAAVIFAGIVGAYFISLVIDKHILKKSPTSGLLVVHTIKIGDASVAVTTPAGTIVAKPPAITPPGMVTDAYFSRSLPDGNMVFAFTHFSELPGELKKEAFAETKAAIKKAIATAQANGNEEARPLRPGAALRNTEIIDETDNHITLLSRSKIMVEGKEQNTSVAEIVFLVKDRMAKLEVRSISPAVKPTTDPVQPAKEWLDAILHENGVK